MTFGKYNSLQWYKKLNKFSDHMQKEDMKIKGRFVKKNCSSRRGSGMRGEG